VESSSEAQFLTTLQGNSWEEKWENGPDIKLRKGMLKFKGSSIFFIFYFDETFWLIKIVWKPSYFDPKKCTRFENISNCKYIFGCSHKEESSLYFMKEYKHLFNLVLSSSCLKPLDMFSIQKLDMHFCYNFVIIYYTKLFKKTSFC